MFFAGELSFNDEVYITNVRHKTALEEAYQSLTMVEKSIAMEMPEDFFSIDLITDIIIDPFPGYFSRISGSFDFFFDCLI